jgi:hypothetical protein
MRHGVRGHRATGDQTAAHRKLGQRRDDPYGVSFRPRAQGEEK